MANLNASVTHYQAIGLAVAAYTCWVLADTGIKIAGASTLPAFQIIAAVGLAEVALLLAYALTRRNFVIFWPHRLAPPLLRSCLDLLNNVCVVIALRHVPLAMFYLLIFLGPLAATALAAFFLREPLKLRQGLAILVGFFGVVVAVDPIHSVHPADAVGYLACLVCVACFSTNLVWSRRMTQTESPQSLAFVSALMMAVVGSLATLSHRQPLPSGFTTVFVAAGFFSVLGGLCFFVALRHTSAATVAQYHYSQLVTGALIGYAIWREGITPAMLAGAVLIIGAGYYTAAKLPAVSSRLGETPEG